jgi:hypothetical protein
VIAGAEGLRSPQNSISVSINSGHISYTASTVAHEVEDKNRDLSICRHAELSTIQFFVNSLFDFVRNRLLLIKEPFTDEGWAFFAPCFAELNANGRLEQNFGSGLLLICDSALNLFPIGCQPPFVN